jgi:hypothetical protein
LNILELNDLLSETPKTPIQSSCCCPFHFEDFGCLLSSINWFLVESLLSNRLGIEYLTETNFEPKYPDLQLIKGLAISILGISLRENNPKTLILFLIK